ncbi:ECHDC1 [Acanthosepion pharaonis]|uniref:ECHDC1 n=1 Tax=Acanthosepion pharaonis TaxID=158019 RepID=A0A812C146_ACAPH|nr:ECHDC1 [Sepia pharaonis]
MDKESGIAKITLNHPEKKNALSGKMIVDLVEIISELEKWKSGKGLFLHGTSHTFCSGVSFFRSVSHFQFWKIPHHFWEEPLYDISLHDLSFFLSLFHTSNFGRSPLLREEPLYDVSLPDVSLNCSFCLHNYKFLSQEILVNNFPSTLIPFNSQL